MYQQIVSRCFDNISFNGLTDNPVFPGVTGLSQRTWSFPVAASLSWQPTEPLRCTENYDEWVTEQQGAMILLVLRQLVEM